MSEHQRVPRNGKSIYSAKLGCKSLTEPGNHTGKTRKREESCIGGEQRKQPRIISTSQQSDCHSHKAIAHWASTQEWPLNFATMSGNKTSRKRLVTGPSYAQQYKNGEAPQAHSLKYEQMLAENNVYMDVMAGEMLVDEESKLLCNKLQQAEYADLEWTAYPLPKFRQILNLARQKNEARVYRDITPVLVPSPEMLHVCGEKDLEHIAEEIDVEWTKCKTLGGPKPKPDLTIGIKRSAFSKKELTKLQNHTSPERATLFSDNLYFPFLLVEAKSGEEIINRADRQNMHSSSIAVNAILQLFSSGIQFNKQILVFSISHDNNCVKVFGHFAIFHDDSISFYRHQLKLISLFMEGTGGQKKVCDFVRAIYHQFYPEHLKRIRNALADMPEPMTGVMNVDEIDASEPAPSSSLLEETTQPMDSSTPPSKKKKGKQSEYQRQSDMQLELLSEQLVEQKRQSNKEQETLREQLAEQQRKDNKQLELWREEHQKQSNKQVELLREQLVEQQRKDDKQLELLREQWAEQQRKDEKQSELLRAQLAEQQRQNDKQLENLKEQLVEQQRKDEKQSELLRAQLAEQQRQSDKQLENLIDQIEFLKEQLRSKSCR